MADFICLTTLVSPEDGRVYEGGETVKLDKTPSGEIYTLKRFKLLADMTALDELQAVKGVGPALARKLWVYAGIQTPAALAVANTAVVAEKMGVKPNQVERWQKEASAIEPSGGES